MREISSTEAAVEDYSVLAFVIKSPCGRTFRVPFEAVREDYVNFLVASDGISREEALEGASFSDLETWFCEQFSWSEVDNVGECIGQPSPEQIQDALDQARGGGSVGSSATLVVRDDLIAQKKGSRLDEVLPESSQPPRKPGVNRF